MRVLVTGASGFIGGHFARALLARGDEVSVICRPERVDATVRIVGESVTVIEDPGSTPMLAAQLLPLDIEATVHLAARFDRAGDAADTDGLIESNIGFAARVAAATAAARPGAPFLNVGSIWQHLGSALFDPVSLYAATKQAFEEVLVYFNNAGLLEVRTLVLPDTYGPDDSRRKVVQLMVEATASEIPVDATSGDGILDLVHVDDVVRGLLRGLDPELGQGRWTLSSGTGVGVRELADQIGILVGRPVPVRWGVRVDPPRQITEMVRVGTLLPQWQPQVALADGLREILTEAGALPRSEAIKHRP